MRRRTSRPTAQPSPPRARSSGSGSTGGDMPTQETDSRGVGAAVKEVAEHASSVVRLELELAALEVKRKVVALGVGIAFAVGAAVMLLFMVGFAYAAAAAALAI